MKRRTAPNCQAWLNVITNSQPTRPAEAQRIANLVRTAFQVMRDGKGDDETFNRLGAAINVGLIRAEAIAPEVEAVMRKGGEALLAAERFKRQHGFHQFTLAGEADLDDALDLYEQILRLSTPLQMSAAAEEGARRIRKGEVLTA